MKPHDARLLRRSQNYSWSEFVMSFASKLHGVHAHAADQAEGIGGKVISLQTI